MPTSKIGILDKRNGLGYSVSLQLSYEAEKKIGTTVDGIDRFVSFTKVPYYTKKTTFNIIAKPDEWDGLFSDMETETLAFATTQTGTYIESVNPGSRLFLKGEEYYDGTYVETYVSGVKNTGAPPNKKFATRSGSVSVGGHWQGDGSIYKKMFFTTTNYGEQATETFTASSAGATMGDTRTIAGVTGLVTAVNQQNPREINGVIVYDYTITVSASKGTSIP